MAGEFGPSHGFFRITQPPLKSYPRPNPMKALQSLLVNNHPHSPTMTSSASSSNMPSRTNTPNPTTHARFTSQASTAEDLLKSQTVGLVHLSDFRKRRAEALEQKEREAQDRSIGRFTSAAASRGATPSDG